MAKMIVSGAVDPRSLTEWESALLGTERKMMKATRRATRLGMAVVEKRVKIYLRTYTHPEGTATPSPPGGPPALVSGTLLRSWRNGPVRDGAKPGTVEMQAGPTVEYARIQELGGYTGRGHRTRLPKRPHVSPMVRVVRREVRRIYLEQWSKTLLSV